MTSHSANPFETWSRWIAHEWSRAWHDIPHGWNAHVHETGPTLNSQKIAGINRLARGRGQQTLYNVCRDLTLQFRNLFHTFWVSLALLLGSSITFATPGGGTGPMGSTSRRTSASGPHWCLNGGFSASKFLPVSLGCFSVCVE